MDELIKKLEEIQELLEKEPCFIKDIINVSGDNNKDFYIVSLYFMIYTFLKRFE
jgi:hypothetical protein